MIGSERKVIEIFKTLQKEGLSAHLFDKVHAPVGLDIGAITPEEIAIAITAELIAVRRHASSQLTHLSWFKSTREESTVDSPVQEFKEQELEEDDHPV
jgi:xanthine dehydrogenase accessory factor